MWICLRRSQIELMRQMRGQGNALARYACPQARCRPANHGRELRLRLDPQLMLEHVPVGFETSAAFHPVALCQMCLDQHSLGALPQWFGGDGHHRCLHSLGEAARSYELTAERLERMEQPLPDAFTFD